jgi:hypothetical protein
MKKVNFIAAVLLILFAAFSRLLPHPPNFAPIAAIALFSGVYLDKRYAFVIPLTAMLISDAVIGFHIYLAWVYAAFIVIACIGLWLKNHKKALYIAGASLASSVVFFVISNFGVWAMGGFGRSLAGLSECYVMAIPFFGNTIMGDMFYTAVMFGAYELVNLFVKKSKEAVN